MKSRSRAGTSLHPLARRAGAAFFVFLALMFAHVVLAAFVPGVRLWGIHHLAYYSSAVRVFALFCVAVTFIAPVSRILYRLVAAFASLLNTRSFVRHVATALIVPGCVACFIAFPSKTHLLGDGQLQSTLLERLAKSPDTGYGYLVEFAAGRSASPATSLLTLAGARAMFSLTSWPPVVMWQVFNALLGGVFALLILSFARNARYAVEIRLLVLSVVLATGAVQLFFGYIETYAPMLVLVAGYFLAALRTLRNRASALLPAVLFLFASLFHVQALLLGPSLVALVVWTLVLKRSSRHVRSTTVVLAAVAVAGTAVLALLPGTARFLLPVIGDNGALAGTHMLDVVNEILLIVPLFPFLVAMGLTAVILRRDQTGAAKSHSTDPARTLPAGSARLSRRTRARLRGALSEPIEGSSREAEAAFATIVALPSALFLLLFFPELGMARDWDLFALPAAAAILVPALLWCDRVLERPGSKAHFERYLAPALAVAGSIVIPWIGVNADEARAVRRYENIIDMDATNPGYGFEILAMHYDDRGREDLEAAAYQKAYEVSKNPRYLAASCSARLKTGDVEGATKTLRDHLAKDPSHILTREVLVEALVRQSKMDDVIRVCRDGIDIHPDHAYFYLYLGIGYFTKGKLSEARDAFDSCQRLDPPKVFVDTMDQVLKRMPQQPRSGEPQRR